MNTDAFPGNASNSIANVLIDGRGNADRIRMKVHIFLGLFVKSSG